jgi:hypothetical protein
MLNFSYRQGADVSAGRGIQMLVLDLESLIIEAATELAISGECDLPVGNKWHGVDLVAPGYYESAIDIRGFIKDGVRLAVEDESIHIYKFEQYGVVASASFKGKTISSSVLVAIAKEWLA